MYLANDLLLKPALKKQFRAHLDGVIEQTMDLVFDIYDAAKMYEVHVAILKVI